MKALPPAMRRVAAVEKVRRKFDGKAFAWGKVDCVTMARSLLVALGRRPPKVPSYRSALAARRALSAQGFDNLEALLDSLLPRIAPAAMLPGDLAAMPGDEGFSALVICAGRKVIGFHEDEPGLVVIEPLEFTAAWKVL